MFLHIFIQSVKLSIPTILATDAKMVGIIEYEKFDRYNPSMLKLSRPKTDFFTTLSTHDLVLTPNQRLAASLQQDYAEFQQAQGKTSWVTPRILSYPHWTLQCWQQMQQDTALPLLLNNQQAQIVWEKIITQSSPAESLLKVPALAELAMTAWELLKHWQIDFETLKKLTYSEETKAFLSWALEFKKIIEENNWVDSASFVDNVILSIEQEKLLLPKKIFLIDFDSTTPQMNLLFKTLKKQLSLNTLDFSQLADSITQVGLPDIQTEIKAMAGWAKNLWKNGSQSIGCIVPNLHQIRDQVAYLLQEQFYEENSIPFNISGGKVLSDYPLIYTAFKIFQLLNFEIDITTINHILRSPFIGEAEEEISQREQFNIAIQEQGESIISRKSLMIQLEKNNCQKLFSRLKHFFDEKHSSTQSPSSWAEYFAKQLHIMGWPGQRTLNSDEYQTTQHFYDLLEEFSRLDYVLEKISLSEAKQYLAKLASQTLFQPKSEQAPIQILGVLEAAGLEFENLWFMGCHHEAWPAKAKPNPLLPIELQKKCQMPHASANRELTFSQQMTKRFCHSAKNVIFSYPLQENDQVLQPSPLIQHFPCEDPKKFTQYISDQALDLFTLKNLEYIQDNYGPTVTPDEIIQGGTAIFKKFADCPFQSFAHIRLEANTLGRIESGLNALQRGIHLHEILKLCWDEIKDSETLHALSKEQLLQIIHSVLERLFNYLKTKHPKTLTPRFINIEKIRLEKLLLRWFELEKSRPAFTVIQQEQEQTMQLGQLNIRFRLDRLDQNSDGSQYIIDYKTGYPNIHDWFGERPEEPQLPLYCIANPEIQGIAFAQVRIDSMNFLGISKEGETFHEIKNIQDVKYNEQPLDWNQQLTSWQTTLEEISNQFTAGNASVDPKNLNKTCQYCDLASLCRIHEKMI